MTKVYSYEQAQEVISEAFNLAVKHLEDTLGDQYKCWNTDDARPKFYDKVEQDIKFKMICHRCGSIDIEGNFCITETYETEVCYECYTELKEED